MNTIAMDNYVGKKTRAPFLVLLICVLAMVALFFQPFTIIRIEKDSEMHLNYYDAELRYKDEYCEFDRTLFDLVKELANTNSGQVRTGSEHGVDYVVFNNEAVFNYALPCAIGILSLIAVLGTLFKNVKMCIISDMLIFGAIAAMYSMFSSGYVGVMHAFELTSSSVRLPYTVWGVALYAYIGACALFLICSIWLGIVKTKAKKEFQKNNKL